MANVTKVNIQSVQLGRSNVLRNKSFENEIRSRLNDACKAVAQHAKSNHWYNDITGNLSRAIKWKVDRQGNRYVGTVYLDERKAFYGKFQIEGTGIYGKYGEVINLNKNGKFYRYYWHRQYRYSYHPLVRGIKGEDFLRKAYKAKLSLISRLFRIRAHRVIKG